MKLNNQITEETVMEELGRRLTRRRIELAITQSDAAQQAGLGKRTLERIEAGEDCRISSLVKLLRILDLMDNLDILVPEPGPHPMELLKMKGKERKRASSHKDEATEPWHWGDGK
jgi:DNA-binding XRE family transcriptional regulator